MRVPFQSACSSVVERLAVNQDVGGSNPPVRAKFLYKNIFLNKNIKDGGVVVVVLHVWM